MKFVPFCRFASKKVEMHRLTAYPCPDLFRTTLSGSGNEIGRRGWLISSTIYSSGSSAKDLFYEIWSSISLHQQKVEMASVHKLSVDGFISDYFQRLWKLNW
jgi:hypothetical protein